MSADRALFFYGTLCHRPLLELVLGPGAGRVRLSEARLDGHRVVWVKDNVFPIILTEPGSVARGLLAEGLRREDIARLDYYEGGYHYELRPVTVEGPDGPVTADVYFAHEGAWEPGPDWSLDDWVARWGAMSMAAAGEYMSLYGRLSPHEMAERFGTIRMRADSRLRAEAETRPRTLGRGGTGRVEVHAALRPFTGYFALDRSQVSFPRFDGSQSEVVTREALVGGDAVTVLPYDPVRDRVLVLEQFRFGAFARGDAQPWTLEPVAGRIDPGETPEQTARRETAEETGASLGALHLVGAYYPSPGAYSEFLYSYVGIADLGDGLAGTGGIADEAEDILAHVIPFERLMEIVASGEADTGPLLLSALWLNANRERLRRLA